MIVIGVLACLLGVWISASEGLAQRFAAYSLRAEQLEPANHSVKFNSSSPEAHYARAKLLAVSGDFASSIKEYERAVALRPADYALWLDLGLTRDRAADTVGAISAFREAASRAPFLRANALATRTTHFIGAAAHDEAAKELVMAASRNPTVGGASAGSAVARAEQ